MYHYIRLHELIIDTLSGISIANVNVVDINQLWNVQHTNM